MTARISAGTIVQPISSGVLPWICFGFSFVARRRYRKRSATKIVRADDDDADDDRDPEERDEQVVDLLGLRALRARASSARCSLADAAAGEAAATTAERPTAPRTHRVEVDRDVALISLPDPWPRTPGSRSCSGTRAGDVAVGLYRGRFRASQLVIRPVTAAVAIQ